MTSLKAFKDSAVYCHSFSEHYQDGWFDESTSNEGYLYLEGQYWIAKEAKGHWWALAGFEEMDSVDLSEVEDWLYHIIVQHECVAGGAA
jgi:hypothetical protein